MSAYIVDDKTINRIITFIDGHMHGTDLLSFETKKILKELLGIEAFKSQKDLEVFGNVLLLMNKKAVDERYKEINNIEELKYKPEHASTIQVLKSLRCYLYQCMEGDIPENRIYKTMRKIEDIIEYDIIDKLPEYEKAEWG